MLVRKVKYENARKLVEDFIVSAKLSVGLILISYGTDVLISTGCNRWSML